MRHLLNGRGTALTECRLSAARRDELTTQLAEMTCPSCRAALINRGVCPECGEEKLTWAAFPGARSLYDWDTETTLHLGCEGCSETLISGVGLDLVVAVLNKHRWRP